MSVERFFVADRQVGWLSGAASLAATQVSAGTFVGAVGIHYAVGVSFLLAWVGIWLGWLFSLFYVAPQLRAFGGMTVPEFFGARFDGDGAGGDRVQAVAAGLVAVIYLVFTSAQYVAGGVVLETAFGVPRAYGMVALAVLALGYTAVGGMRASVTTDVVLAVLMICGLLAATAVGLGRIGGLGSLHAAVVATEPALLGLSMNPADLAGFALAFGLALAVAPYEVGRVYAMRDERTVRRSILGSLLLQVVIALCIVVLGLLARVTFPGLSNPDAAVVELITAYFGPVVGGLLLLGVLAAVLSTIDSILLVSASAIAYDLYRTVLADSTGPSDGHGTVTERGTTPSDSTRATVDSERPTTRGTGGSDADPARTAEPTTRGTGGSDAAPARTAEPPAADRSNVVGSSALGEGTDVRSVRTLRVARLTTVACGLLPLVLAFNSSFLGGLVQLIVALYSALVAGALFAPVVLGLHWDGMTTAGAIAGMTLGTTAVVAWHLLTTVSGLLPPGLAAVPPVVAGVVTSAGAVVAGSTGR